MTGKSSVHPPSRRTLIHKLLFIPRWVAVRGTKPHKGQVEILLENVQSLSFLLKRCLSCWNLSKIAVFWQKVLSFPWFSDKFLNYYTDAKDNLGFWEQNVAVPPTPMTHTSQLVHPQERRRRPLTRVCDVGSARNANVYMRCTWKCMFFCIANLIDFTIIAIS